MRTVGPTPRHVLTSRPAGVGCEVWHILPLSLQVSNRSSCHSSPQATLGSPQLEKDLSLPLLPVSCHPLALGPCMGQGGGAYPLTMATAPRKPVWVGDTVTTAM